MNRARPMAARLKKKITIFRAEATSALADFQAGPLSSSFKLGFENIGGERKLENPEKNPQSKE